jgi:glyoxylase-like metal-dependent hydrolase (beta-lactamase superfamily II)
MIKQINETTYKILGDGNIYLLLDDKPIVIDTSDRVDSLQIKIELEKLINLEDVVAVLLTHMHYDHSGNIDLFPNAQVYCSEEELANFREDPQDSLFSAELSPMAVAMLRNAKKLGNDIYGLKILYLPGHTLGSVAYVDEKNKVIFTGDTYFRDGVIGRTDLPNSIGSKMANSLDIIEEYITKGYTVCPGHDY